MPTVALAALDILAAGAAALEESASAQDLLQGQSAQAVLVAAAMS